MRRRPPRSTRTDTLFPYTTPFRSYDEAAALDERRFDDWVAMLHEELVYTAPIRLTRTGPNRDRDVVRTMKHFDDDYASILMRTGRLSKSAWAEDPPSR